ncbi:MAG: hypothetical protein ACTS4Z_00120 [Candidatus Hodgkinia cicadicola]
MNKIVVHSGVNYKLTDAKEFCSFAKLDLQLITGLKSAYSKAIYHCKL